MILNINSTRVEILNVLAAALWYPMELIDQNFTEEIEIDFRFHILGLVLPYPIVARSFLIWIENFRYQIEHHRPCPMVDLRPPALLRQVATLHDGAEFSDEDFI
jgi:hypothetical protein